MCKVKANKNKKLVQGQIMLTHTLENSMVMQMLYYLIEQNSKILGIPIPKHLIPNDKIQLSNYPKYLKDFISIEERRHEKTLNELNKNIGKSKRKSSRVRQSLIDKFSEISERRERVINIDNEIAKNEIKKIAIKVIQKNTQKFPIFTPQDVYKIDRIISKIKNILTSKDNNDIGTNDVIAYFSENTKHINSMIDETFFE